MVRAQRWAVATAFTSICIGAGPAWAYDIITADPGAKTLSVGLELRGRLTGTFEQVDPVPVDDEGVVFDPGLLFTSQATLGAELQLVISGKLPIIINAEVEGYVYSGQLLGSNDVDGVDMPADQSDELYLKTAFLRVSLGPILTVGGGFASTSWGLGLVANGGNRDRDWDAGAARFADPYLGDTNLRLLVATGPHGPVQIFGFRDVVQEENTFLPGDEATQYGGGVRIGSPKGPSGGVYLVHRDQEASDGDTTRASAIDVAGRWPIQFDDGASMLIEGEVVYIKGETELAPTFDNRTHRVQQFGAALRTRFQLGRVGLVLDALFASGDQDLSDSDQNAFRADRNYELGLLLFRYVTAAQTGYAPTTASDPNLVGVPSEDLNRFPTQGAVSNTIAFFPRVYYRPLPTLEIYGGPLVAFSQVPLIDPLNTTYNGGVARNAFDGDPGNYLGTELDLGVRGYIDLAGVELHLRLEGGVLFPGDAFNDANGDAPDALLGGRAALELAF